MASQRRGQMDVVLKPGGLPELTRFWAAEAERIAAGYRCAWRVLEVDYAAYILLRDPDSLDVLAAPNCFGDILADLGGYLGGSRGLTYGASFSSTGAAVYQTNHGAAYELAGTDRCNPVGQMLALAYLLRESLRVPECAEAIEHAIRATWSAGFITEDLVAAGGQVVTTTELTRRIADRITAAGLARSAA
jgi:3-isopropylmalate dehydrogenase